jgi:hypothetical protein
MTQPIYYQYSYLKGSTRTAAPVGDFEVAAFGDLDADSATSSFARTGKINTTTGQLVLASQLYIDNEME